MSENPVIPGIETSTPGTLFDVRIRLNKDRRNGTDLMYKHERTLHATRRRDGLHCYSRIQDRYLMRSKITQSHVKPDILTLCTKARSVTCIRWIGMLVYVLWSARGFRENYANIQANPQRRWL